MVRNTPLQFELHTPQSSLRAAIIDAYRRDEAQSLDELMGQINLPPASRYQVQERARRLVTAVRGKRTHASGVDALLHEFSLSSQEGIALMCLAEALLRIPDRETANRLIRDKISGGGWDAHLGHSPSLFVNAAAWGLLITRKLVSTHSEGGLTATLTRLVEKGGEPLIRRAMDLAMRMLGHQFVIGETIEKALERSREHEARGYRYSYDMLGEAALTAADAERYYASYEAAIHAIGKAAAGQGVHAGAGISVKLSALHPRYVRAQRERVIAELLPRLKSLLALARQYDIGLDIDAEEADRLELSLDLLEALAFDPELAGWDGIGFVVQAYQKRCPAVIDWIIDLARRSSHRIMVRLVKGAYWDAEIKRAQVEGLEDYPVYTRKVHTDVCYLACAQKMLGAPDAIYPQFATHNAHTLSAVYQMAQDARIDDYEFQCLHGMGEALYDQVVGAGQLAKPCRIYAPVGNYETLLPYLVRRLLENGANSSFVSRTVDEDVSIDELVADPLAQVEREGARPHPAIPLPCELYGAERRNSSGIDFSDEHALARLAAELAEFSGKDTLDQSAVPMLADGDRNDGERLPVLNPADRTDCVGTVIEASDSDVEAALAAAQAFAPEWQATPPGYRAMLLEHAADALEAHRSELIGLAVREAGKSLPNGLAEVREAVDFCRYYAQQLRSQFAGSSKPEALGPVVCISPWNFPLAIFIGEVSAAFAAGNPVLAKPAEQTPLIAAAAVRLLHEAGIPRAALQLLPGRGETVGAHLIGDGRVRGVIFTGSTEVAQLIHRTLAERSHEGEVTLIAETGGQNAMIVDSSARLEQMVQDVLVSAFDSAGQRCSSLRVLCLQEEIADRALEMLKGAMQELALGNPGRLATDVGPVIDVEAQGALLAHIEKMHVAGHAMFQLPLPHVCANGTFVPPTLIEINDISELEREVFGPVLHVVRFAHDRLDELVNSINATGYGLTLGIHSRIDETIDFIVTRAHVGNIYVNRNMIGAVVGVQPFGGEGKSGTGPKAGGPLYLYRLLRQALVSLERIGGVHENGERNQQGEPEALAALRALGDWAQQTGRVSLFELCQDYRARTPLRYRIPLPGPTGESNTLVFAPRGEVACLANDEETLLEQIAGALATGNRVLLADGSIPRALVHTLPPAVREQLRIEQDWMQAAPDVVLHVGSADDAYRLRNELAARDGARVPLISAAGKNFPLYRLTVERVVSVNTAAAGGNASLMTLDA
ncbi:trifunctional transcriptional regulator/proline dehydrogenase/L-glutamate gamma-semialdehyde dehydrogenase [Nitrosovibrio sp. Nv4]|uniref:trifunctional transcriptional regulator/proline dehydrogenase/L-glutamate gamma-semialdehyde dehydrogenase n=1 Tax=Nitrosovibrio sp. Nv4 TaxID=1945880 RepID=UPI000BD282EB|nr:trifunctional transcriptional regulator/proline dehydrogenase/L-glutamate gamma-semialdehyde dehydrogenase [Nitrosovibrio sp. Nv4]SOD42567.1 L-proline dehydrogenase /delta-1-pyrroline-5-carboxylate dehydrogenase [Nitrosovibrio sp. Nv4]